MNGVQLRLKGAAEADAYLLGISLDFTRDREKNRRLQESAETLRRLYVVDEWERTRLSGSIHDGLLQDVIAADMLLQTAKSLGPKERLDWIEEARVQIDGQN